MSAKKTVLSTFSSKRRSFLKYAGLSSLGLGIGPLFARWGNTATGEIPAPVAAWGVDLNGNRYFEPKNIKTNLVNSQNTVYAKVDNWWKKYPVREFSDEFHDWWIAEKNWYYDQLIAYFEGETDSLVLPNGGHHHPMLSTYGRYTGRRGDSDFHLNCAVKGFTIIPKEDKIDYVNEEIEKAYAGGNIPVGVFKKRQELYQQKDLWDKTRFATLELYSGRPVDKDDSEGKYGFMESKTFQNLYANPMATLNYMSLYNTDGTQSYFEGQAELTPEIQFRGVCWLISYYNPANTEYEQKVVEYINNAHCNYHGGSCTVIANVFLIVEEFNETPDYDPGRGKRTVPSFPYIEGLKTAAVHTPEQGKKLTREEKMAVLKKLRIPV